jgi:hypothetical protein
MMIFALGVVTGIVGFVAVYYGIREFNEATITVYCMEQRVERMDNEIKALNVQYQEMIKQFTAFHKTLTKSLDDIASLKTEKERIEQIDLHLNALTGTVGAMQKAERWRGWEKEVIKK